jgi:hypothetical protein
LHEWRPGISRAKRPPSTERVHLKYEREDIADLVRRLREIPADQR